MYIIVLKSLNSGLYNGKILILLPFSFNKILFNKKYTVFNCRTSYI